MVTRVGAERFVTERQIPRVVMAYDVTLPGPESVSILWATGGPEVRALAPWCRVLTAILSLDGHGHERRTHQSAVVWRLRRAVD